VEEDMEVGADAQAMTATVEGTLFWGREGGTQKLQGGSCAKRVRLAAYH